MPSLRQTGSARNNTPGSHLLPAHGGILKHSLSASMPAGELNSRCPQCGLLAHFFWLLSLFLTSMFPYRCFLHLLSTLLAPNSLTLVCSDGDLNQDKGFPGGSVVKNPPAIAGDVGSIPGSGRSLGEGNGNPLHAWKIPWTEEPDRLPSSSVQCSCSVVSDSLRPHESQHARPPCPSQTP